MSRIKSLLKKTTKPLGYLAILLLRVASRYKIRIPEKYLVAAHLVRAGSPLHPNKAIFIKVLREFEKSPLRIIETGTSAWGADSTRLWDEYVRASGGQVISVDIRTEPSEILRGKVSKKTTFAIADSVVFLADLVNQNYIADLIYLDSFDVDWLDPSPAEQHGAKEFELAKKLIRIGGIILIDDTPTVAAAIQIGVASPTQIDGEPVEIRGKGAEAVKAVRDDPNFIILSHEYAIAIKRIS